MDFGIFSVHGGLDGLILYFLASPPFRSIMRFRRDVLPSVAPHFQEPRLKALNPEQGVRIVYGIMIHDDPQRFEVYYVYSS